MIPGARLIILGRQGAGKGTQCTRLSRHFVVPHISTGDMLRAAVRQGTDLGRMAKKIMDDGGLVGDDVMIGIVRERLSANDANVRGYILDGFPRTIEQADALDEIAGPEKPRADDTPESVNRRLDLYEEQTFPLIKHYGDQGRLAVVNGVGHPDSVFDRLVKAVEMNRR